MPKIRLVLESESAGGRPVEDPISMFLLESRRAGRIREAHGISVDSKQLRVDAAPDDYTVQIEMEGYRDFAGKFTIKADSPPIVPIKLKHRSKSLPEFTDLLNRQKELLGTFDGSQPAGALWKSISENRAAAFFQVTFALTQKRLANGRTLDSYIDKIRRIAGARVDDDIPDGKSRSATGWRLHVTINPADRGQFDGDLLAGGFRRDDFSHSTHAKYGLTKSHRETGDLPRLQIVLNETNSSRENTHADVDLDVELHRSAPHDVFRRFAERFPLGTEVYKY